MTDTRSWRQGQPGVGQLARTRQVCWLSSAERRMRRTGIDKGSGVDPVFVSPSLKWQARILSMVSRANPREGSPHGLVTPRLQHVHHGAGYGPGNVVGRAGVLVAVAGGRAVRVDGAGVRDGAGVFDAVGDAVGMGEGSLSTRGR